MYSMHTMRCNIRRVRDTVRRYFGSTRGATATEYAIVACLVAVAITGAVWLVGDAVKSDYDAVADRIGPETAGPNNSLDTCRRGGANCGGSGRVGGGQRGKK